jgi:hypothetical protein
VHEEAQFIAVAVLDGRARSMNVSRMKYLGLGLTFAGSVMLVGAVGVGCLGRTNPDDDELEAQGALDDAAGGDTAVVVDSSTPLDTAVGTDTAPKPDTAPPPRDTYIDFFDIFPIPDSGPIGECASCVATNCSKQVNACLNDPTCRNGLACTVMKCLAGGGGGGTPDLGCVLTCFGGDFSKAAEAIAAFTCVTGKCGTACGGLLGGGGIPGGGPPRDAGGGGSTDAAKSSSSHVFTPEELQSMDPRTTFDVPPQAFRAWSAEIGGAACAQGLGPTIAPAP